MINLDKDNGNYVVNPRGFFYNSRTHYKLELAPIEFLEGSVSWIGQKEIISTPYEDNGLFVWLHSSKKDGDFYDNEITIQIPDYYESPPKFTVRIYNVLKTINIKPVVIKYSSDDYINYFYQSDNTETYLTHYAFANAHSFNSIFTNKLHQQKDFANIIFRQIGVRLNLDSVEEQISQDIFAYELGAIDNNVIKNLSLTNPYNGIKLYLVDSFWKDSKRNRSVLAFNYKLLGGSLNYGVVYTKNTPNEAISHEICHAMGLSDIYLDNQNRYERSTQSDELNDDFTGEINYYSKKHSEIITSCLMFGIHNDNPSKYCKIIPLGNVSGNHEKNTPYFPMSIPVGQKNLNKNPKTGIHQNE